MNDIQSRALGEGPEAVQLRRVARAVHVICKWDRGDERVTKTPEYWISELDQASAGADPLDVLRGDDDGNDADVYANGPMDGPRAE